MRCCATAGGCPIRRCSCRCRRSTNRRWRLPAARAVRARAGAQPRRRHRLVARTRRRPRRPARRPRPLGYPDRHRGRDARRPDPTGMRRGSNAARRSRCPTASSRPGRSARRTSSDGSGLVFVGSSTVPGVGVPMVLVSGELAARRVAALDRGRGVSPELERSYALCRTLTREPRHHLLLGGELCSSRQQRRARVGAVRLRPSRRRHRRRRSTRCRSPSARRPSIALGDRLFDGPRRRRVRRPAAGGRRRHGGATRHRPRLLPPLPALDAHGSHVTGYDTWDDLLGYMDGSAAVIGEMMLPVLRPTSPAALEPARDLGLAFQLTNFLRDVGEDLDSGASTSRGTTSSASAPTRGADGRQRWRSPDALRDRPLPPAVPLGRRRDPDAAAAPRDAACAPLASSTARSSIASRPPTTTCSPAG